MDPLNIVLKIDGADQVQAGAAKAGDALKKFGVAGQQAGQQVQLSGAQMAAVSNQLQDLFIQIQGGQAPLTALLQQGSQLSAQFGGMGGAVRALTSLITPATVAMGGLGAAAGVAALAYSQASDEAQAYARAVVLTGNAAGVTIGQMRALARAQSEIVGTQGDAAEALAALVATGRVAGSVLETAAEAATRLARVGVPIEETAKKFAALGKDPLKALIDINEAENFLTESVYKQVRALTEQGRMTEAAQVAQVAWARSGIERSEELERGLGGVARAWIAVKDSAGEAWDSMVGVAREPSSLWDRLKAELENYKRTSSVFSLSSGAASVGGYQTASAREAAAADAAAQAQAALNAKRRAGVEWLKEGEKYLTRQQLLEREIAQIRQLGAKAGAQQAEIEARIAATREKGAESTGKLNAEREREASLLERASGLSGSFFKELASYDALRRKGLLTEQLYVSTINDLVQSQPFAIELTKKQAEAARQVADAEARGVDLYEKNIAALSQRADAAARQVQTLTAEAEAAKLASFGQLTLAQALEEVAIARLKDEQRAAGTDDRAVAAIQREIDKRRELVGLLGGQEMRRSIADASRELDRFLDPSRAETFGEALSRAFDGAGNSLAALSNALTQYTRQQADLGKVQAAIDKEADPAKKLRAQIKLNEDAQKSTIGLYAGMAGAAKGFFSEGTKGYKALEAAETAFRAYQLASDLVKGASAAAVAVANQAQGDPYTAWARMAAMAAAMASLGFVVSGGLAGGGSSGGDGAPQATGKGTVFGDAQAMSESIGRAIERLSETSDLQLSTQSGMLASLRSIESSIGGITNLVLRGQAANGSAAEQFGIREGTTVSNGLLTSLITGGAIGGAIYGIDKLLFDGRITNALFGKKITVTGNGLYAAPQALGAIAIGGLGLQDYVDVNKKQKFLGITVSNSNSSQYSAADPQLQQQFGQVFKDIYSVILQASDPLGVALDKVKGQLDGFIVNIGKIDLKDLTGEQISEKLSAVLGAASDQIAAAALPGLQAFQKVGEGYFETVIRVASGVETAQAALELLGVTAIKFTDISKTQADVATEIVRQSIVEAERSASRFVDSFGTSFTVPGTVSSVGQLISSLDGTAEDIVQAYRSLVDVRDVLIAVGASGDSLTAAMIRGAGGLDQLQSSLGDYLENFYSQAERDEMARARLQSQFTKLGLGELPQSREAFRDLVMGIDDSTESGQKLYAQVVGLSKAFADLVPAVASVADTTAETLARLTRGYADSRAQLEIELQRALGDEAGARARERALQLSRDSVGLSAEDAAAVAALYDYNVSLRDQISAARAAVEAQRAIEAAQKAAAETAQRAAEALQRTFADLADTRFGLENELLTQQGNAAEVLRRTRERDLGQLTSGLTAEDAARVAAAYDYNAELRRQIELYNTAKTAAEAAAQAEQERQRDIAANAAAVLRQGEDIQARIDQLTGNTAAIRARELLALDPANRARQQYYYDLLDAADAQERANSAAQEAARIADEQARAAQQLREAWQSIGDTLVEEAERILGLDSRFGQLSLAQAQARFATTTAQARAGDQDAARLLPELGRSIVELVGETATSRAELERVQAQVAASLKGTAAVVTGGSARAVDVPALLSQVAAMAPVVNVASTQQQTAAAAQDSLAALVAEVRSLRAQVQALQAPADRAASATERTRDLLTQVTDNGLAMQVESVS